MDEKHGQIQLLQFVLLAVSIITLFFVIAIFNRTGEDLGTVVQEETKDAIDSTKLVAARAKARTELIALQAKVTAGMAAEEAAQEAAEIKAELGEAYVNANAEAKQELNEFEQDFEALEQGLRNGTANALDLLEDLAARLEAEVRTDD